MSKRSGHQRLVAVSSRLCVRSSCALRLQKCSPLASDLFSMCLWSTFLFFVVRFLPRGSLTESALGRDLHPDHWCVCACIFSDNDYCVDSVMIRPRRPSVLQWLTAVRTGDSGCHSSATSPHLQPCRCCPISSSSCSCHQLCPCSSDNTMNSNMKVLLVEWTHSPLKVTATKFDAC